MKHKKLTILFDSPVILSFALISLIVLVLDKFLGGWLIPRYFSVYRSSLANPFTYLRFFTHVLGHSDYTHYMNNMLLLLIVGPSLEDRYGSERILEAIVLTALVTGVVQFIFFPNSALLGASGIVFMMIIMSSFAGYRNGSVPVTLILVFALSVGREVVNAVSKIDNVSQLTHIIGGVCGAGFGFSMTGKGRRR